MILKGRWFEGNALFEGISEVFIVEHCILNIEH
jgi:hypothetical protein